MAAEVEEVALPFGKTYPVKTYWKRHKNSQPRPHHAPLPYLHEYCTGALSSTGQLAKQNNKFAAQDVLSIAQLQDTTRYTKAHNGALEKVDAKLRMSESFFEDWYERKASVELVASAAKGILKFLRGWKNPAYWKSLKAGAQPSDLPSAWLAYNFGVKPLIGSVDRGINLLGADFPIMKVHGTSSDSLSDELDYSTLSESDFSSNKCTRDYQLIVKMGCEVYGINPNSALLGATGLNEPFSSIAAVVPWGWAVEYFVNVSQLLSNFENKHPGIKTRHWYITYVGKCNLRFTYREPKWSDSISPEWPAIARARSAFTYNCNAFTMRRYIEKPRFKLEFYAPPLGGNKLANLFSAIALTMKGKG